MACESRLFQLTVDFPSFFPVVTKLNEAKIAWALSGSGCLFVHGNERRPDDLDLFVRDEDHDRVDQLFAISSIPYRSPLEDVRNSHPLNDEKIQITSHLRLMIDGTTYSLSLSQSQLDQRQEAMFHDQSMWLLAPEDVLISKALLQRGVEQGKHDLQDIRDFVTVYPTLNKEYIQSRLKELGAEERTRRVLGKLIL